MSNLMPSLAIATPAALASSTPRSVRGESTQEMNRLSLFHMLSPCLMSTTSSGEVDVETSTHQTYEHIQTYGHTDMQTHTNIHTDIQTYRHTDTQTYRHTDIQTYRHTDIQTYRHTGAHTHREGGKKWEKERR